ncbi:unnamed protein product [Effrenium voratum]|nr:unnamed protein product [Effrenium voratum]
MAVVAGNETPVLLQDLPSALPDLVDVVGFLDPYGYKARSPLEWSEWKAVPELTLEVCGHSKVDGHTVYDVKCALAAPGCWHSPFLAWRSLRRLSHLQQAGHGRTRLVR